MIDDAMLTDLEYYGIPILDRKEYAELLRLARLGLKAEASSKKNTEDCTCDLKYTGLKLHNKGCPQYG